ncbi:MAG: TRAP transporter large permease [Bacillota bacterium]|jgi:C4-dicarboxylate transporter DctM subunit
MSVGIFFLIFFALLLIGTPIGAAFAGICVLKSIFDPSFPFPLIAIVRSMVNGVDSYPLLAIPLFMLSGVIMAKGGISEKIFNFFGYFFGNKTAGFPIAVTATCLFYGAISGSGPATTAAVGSMTIPFLISMGYDKTFSTALVAISGGLGVIIPPSIPFIVYCSIASTSVSDLFIAGFLPGILIGLCLMVYSYIYCRNKGEDKEKLNEKYNAIRKQGFFAVLKDSIWALLAPIIVLGSIYGGIASTTEAAALSIYYALFVSVFIYKTINFKNMYQVFKEGVGTYAAIMLIMSGAVAFSHALTLMNVGALIRDNLLALFNSKFMILLLINLVLLVAGMLVDCLSAILILAPIMLPVVTAIGVHPVHFGIIMVVNLAIGFVTPPMGMNLFVASNLTKIPVMDIAKRSLPFIFFFAVATVLINVFPEISLILLNK